ncbi:hypothetical protein C483_01606 [Natrialba hulunbeirensis JCM 10989]|uniref:Major facilitator superfamily protein n=1 Tax=Natrialba hulunbeirensis JCM 10989 TaxID=1227493 RepID=M0A939_9EURY|nr:MFS transporter [Natrialba hulunbeirensis]ELY95019.1 hypothetical protein C483_01606 [Natrialba hulunbeirensis JCM 10989]
MRVVLRQTQFRRLFLGRLIANAGDSLYYVAAMWLVFELGGSAFYTGLAGFLARFPMVLQLLVGPLVDRYPLGRILVSATSVQALLLLVIPAAAVTGQLTVWTVLLVMPFVALAGQFLEPAQKAAVPRLVTREELVSANAAISVAYQGTNLVFMAVGGVLVGLIGATALFVVDSIALGVAAVCFVLLSIPSAGRRTGPEGGPTGAVADGDRDSDSAAVLDADGGDATTAETRIEDTAATQTYLGELREGLRYVRGSIIVPMFVGTFVLNFATGAMMAVLPVFAAQSGGPSLYGTLLAAISCGVLLGALSASKIDHIGMGRLFGIGFLASTLAWAIALGIDSALITAVGIGAAWIITGSYNVISASLKQSYVPDTLLGRISSISFSISTGALPLGSLLGGLAGDVFGPTAVMGTVGVAFAGLAGYWFIHPQLRTLPAVDRLDPERYGLGTT